MPEKKVQAPTPVQNEVKVAVEAPYMPEATKIWNEIKEVQLNMFALPDQTVEKYCSPITVEPSKLYMTIKVSSVLTSLEDALGKVFEFQPAGKFVIVTRK